MVVSGSIGGDLEYRVHEGWWFLHTVEFQPYLFSDIHIILCIWP